MLFDFQEVFEDKPTNMKRRDSGLVDTDDGDSDKCDLDKLKANFDSKNTKFSVSKSGNGKYMEVNFKNDMIFDLDM